MRQFNKEIDIDLVEELADALYPLQVGLQGAIGTPGEAVARRKLLAAIEELNMVLEGDGAVKAIQSEINKDFNNV